MKFFLSGINNPLFCHLFHPKQNNKATRKQDLTEYERMRKNNKERERAIKEQVL